MSFHGSPYRRHRNYVEGGGGSSDATMMRNMAVLLILHALRLLQLTAMKDGGLQEAMEPLVGFLDALESFTNRVETPFHQQQLFLLVQGTICPEVLDGVAHFLLAGELP